MTLEMYLPIYTTTGYFAEWHTLESFLIQPLAIQIG